MNKEELYDQIEAYLKGSLSAEERAALEREIESNPEAALELQLQQVELDAMEVLLERDLRGKVSQWFDDDEVPPPSGSGTPPSPNASRPSRFWIAVVLGAVAVLAVVVWRMDWLGVSPQTPPETPRAPAEQTPQDVGPVAEQEKIIPNKKPLDAPQRTPKIRPAPDSPPAGGRMIAFAGAFYEDLSLGNIRKGAPGSDDQDTLSEIIRAYEKKQYHQALKLLNEVPASSSYAIRALEIRAHILYQLKNYTESAVAFAAVAATGRPPYAERAQWNQLVCYAAQYPASKTAFDALLAQLLADADHSYYEKALELQARLPK